MKDRSSHRERVLRRFALVLAVAVCQIAAVQAETPAPPAPLSEQRTFAYYLFGGGGVVGVACTVPILLISVAAFALVVELLLTIRRAVLMPRGLAEEVHGLVANGAFPHAEQQCKLRPSYLSHVILAGLVEVRHGYPAVEKAMEDASQAEAARLFRKVEFLSVIANIATMLGLFGTVVGLVMAFKQVADTQGVARASDLAAGIYLALMTTIEGLAIAIPSVAAYALFRNRADQLIAETALLGEYAFAGYRRERLARRQSDAVKPAKPAKPGL